MRHSRSEGDFLRLPKILSPQNQRGKGNLGPQRQLQKPGYGFRRDFMNGLTPQAVRLNDGAVREMQRRPTAKSKELEAGTDSAHRRNLALQHQVPAAAKEKELAIDVTDFENRVKELASSIVTIQRETAQFSGSVQADAAAAALRKSTSAPNLKKGGEEGDDEDTAEDELRERILKYRFVRKIEPDLPPLPPLSSLESDGPELKAPQGHMILRNRSPEYLKRWRPEEAALWRRDAQSLARERMQKVRQRHDEILEALMQPSSDSAFDDSSFAVGNPATRRNSKYQKKDKSEIPRQRWQVLLCVVNFMLVNRGLLQKYKIALREYTKELEKQAEAEKQAKKSAGGWQAARRASLSMQLRNNILVDQFVRAAQLNQKSSRRSLLLLDSDAIRGKMPVMPEDEKTWHTTMFMQTFVLGKLRVRARRARCSFIWSALTAWKTSGSLMVAFKHYHKRVRKIQRFWRKSEAYIRGTREQVAVRWIEFEREQLRKKLGAARTGGEQLSLSERVDVAMLDEKKRTKYLKGEMRIRRYELLPAIVLWQGDMRTYYENVEHWKHNREACKLMGVDNTVACPMMPGVPSHIPLDEDIMTMIVRARQRMEPRSIKDLAPRAKVDDGSESMAVGTMGNVPLKVESAAEPAPVGGPQNLTPPPADPDALSKIHT